MPHTVFFSWQSDCPNAVGRTMIEACLGNAIKALHADADVRLANRDTVIDQDTLGIQGTPRIADSIYDKIDHAAVFLSDLTNVAFRPERGGIPTQTY